MSQKVYQLLNDIAPLPTAHGKGEKFIFLTQQDTQTSITQFAFGKLMHGEHVTQHIHPTMEECFYFINGEGEYLIDNIVYAVKPNSFFRIPANTMHALRATGGEPLLFVYFGVALQ